MRERGESLSNPALQQTFGEMVYIVSDPMNNIVLGLFLVGAAAMWRRSGYWLPASVPHGLVWRKRVLATGGFAIALLATGFAIGDAIAGRAQIARNPVQYATRLSGSDAHHHDLADASHFWRQVLLEGAFGLAIGGSLIMLGRQSRPIARNVAS